MDTKPTTQQRPGRKPKAFKTTELLKRAQTCRRRVFTISEDKIIIKCVSSSKFDNDWESVARLLSSRSARQCRDRWMYYLSPSNNLAPFTPDEDQLIVQKVNEMGKKWSQISKFFNGRSDNSIKNRWYSKLVSKCDVDESGVYSLDPRKVIDTPDKRKSHSKKISSEKDNSDKNDVSEPEYICDQVTSQNNGLSILALKQQQQGNVPQKNSELDFWDSELIEWPDDIFGSQTRTEYDFFREY